MRKSNITTIIITVVLMFSGFNANAQLGVTREGKIKHLVTGVSPWYFDSYNLNFVPKYQTKLKQVTIKTKRMEYREFDDSWVNEWFFEYKIHFDELGNIVKIAEWSKEAYGKEYPIDHDNMYGITNFSYKEGKVILVEGSGIYSFKYDNNGYLSKIVGGRTLRTTWTPQGFLYTAKEYEGDHLRSWFESNIKYLYSQNGHVIEKIYLKNDNTFFKTDIIYKDPHGVMTKNVQSDIYYYENNYDESGDLFQHLEYKMVDGEKLYKIGWQYEYEYEFYE